MRPRGGARLLAVPLTLVLLATASGCGGSDEPSKTEYYGAVGAFCGKVTTAAKHVSTESAAVRQDSGATPAASLKRITTALSGFADAAEAALKELEKAGVPSQYATFQKGTATGFRRYVSTLRATAHDADKDPTVLTKLETRLNAVRLPDIPKDITANAKACASFSTPTG
jgi:hypothetical protein